MTNAAPQTKLTPVELRQQMNELIGYYKRAWGDAQKAAGKQIRAALEANRFLTDQVPNSILDAVFAQEDRGARAGLGSRIFPMAKRTHLPRYPDNGSTLCGRRVSRITLIGRHEIVDVATCKACQRADDALQIREHERARKAAGKKPGEWF